MAQTKRGAMIIACKKLQISPKEYLEKTKSGLKRCYKCKIWLPKTDFGKDKSRYDELASACNGCRSKAKGVKRKNLAPSKKRQQQISSLLNYAIKKGRLAKPSILPCFYCSKKAVEYHHHLGYSDSHIYDVRAVCKKCHVNLHWDN